MSRRIITLSTAVALPMFIAACATTQPEDVGLAQARSTYERVADDPEVARSAARQLSRAEENLEQAERMYESGVDDDIAAHHAYVAGQHSRVAAEQARRERLQAQIESAAERREEMIAQARSREAEESERESERLRAELERLEAEETDRGIVLTLGDVLFDTGEADLRGRGADTVGRLAEFMRDYPERRVRIEGYTDSTGSESFNQALSERRAAAVQDALTRRGIDPERIEAIGYGESHPVAPNDTAGNRQLNRRVEVVISDAEGNIQSR